MVRLRALVLGYFIVPVVFDLADGLTWLAFTKLGIFSPALQIAILVATAVGAGWLLARSAVARVSPNAALTGVVIGFALWFGMHALMGRLAFWTPSAGQISF